MRERQSEKGEKERERRHAGTTVIVDSSLSRELGGLAPRTPEGGGKEERRRKGESTRKCTKELTLDFREEQHSSRETILVGSLFLNAPSHTKSRVL